MIREPVIIIGAGPAGLTAAYELGKRNIRPVVFEKSGMVGGLARTEIYEDFCFDIGGHRFFTKLEDVQRLWEEVLGEELVRVKRLSRIYYRGQFFNYPLQLLNTLSNLGFTESVLILLSYFRAKLFPYPEEKNFDQWVTNRFGRRLFLTFFKGYTEKVWGMPSHAIQADWVAQRIHGLSVKTVIASLLFGDNRAKSLISEFYYPKRGPGSMWDGFRKALEHQGGKVHFNTEAVRFHLEGDRIRGVTFRNGKQMIETPGNYFISSIPLKELLLRLDPAPPAEVLRGARELVYRDFILVGLIVKRPHLFPDQWVYIHSPELKVGRIQNFKNWSPWMVRDPSKTSLGMEYFCKEGDDLWRMSDDELTRLASDELVRLGWVKPGDVDRATIIRQTKAYPVYESGYRDHLRVIREFLSTLKNLQTIGRNGLHRYNNQDHSMLTALLAVQNIWGANHDLWELTQHREYLE
jgi:protoporphyrinogen oxidase